MSFLRGRSNPLFRALEDQSTAIAKYLITCSGLDDYIEDYFLRGLAFAMGLASSEGELGVSRLR